MSPAVAGAERHRASGDSVFLELLPIKQDPVARAWRGSKVAILQTERLLEYLAKLRDVLDEESVWNGSRQMDVDLHQEMRRDR